MTSSMSGNLTEVVTPFGYLLSQSRKSAGLHSVRIVIDPSLTSSPQINVSSLDPATRRSSARSSAILRTYLRRHKTDAAAAAALFHLPARKAYRGDGAGRLTSAIFSNQQTYRLRSGRLETAAQPASRGRWAASRFPVRIDSGARCPADLRAAGGPECDIALPTMPPPA